MNASRLIHRCDVQRQGAVVGPNADLTLTGYATFLTGLPCLIEPLDAWRQRSILGEMTGLRWRFSWGSQPLRDGDRVVNLRDPAGALLASGKTYLIRLEAQDTFRPPWSSVMRFQLALAEEEIVET